MLTGMLWFFNEVFFRPAFTLSYVQRNANICSSNFCE